MNALTDLMALTRSGPARFRQSWCKLLLLTALAASSAPAHGQLLPGLNLPGGRADTPEARPDAPAVAEPEAIPVERIPARIEQHRELVRRVTEATRPNQEVETIRQQLAGLEAQFVALRDGHQEEALARLDLRSLEGDLETLAALRRSVVAMRAAVGRQVDVYSGWHDRAAHAAESWRLTESALAEREIPAQMSSSIAAMRDALGEAQARARTRLDEALELQNTLADSLAVVDDRIGVVNAELARARIALFRAEHPPIWAGNAEPLDLATYQEAWRSDWRTVREFLAAHPGQLWMHFALLVFLLGAFAMLAQQVSRWVKANPDLAEPLAVFRHPLAAALILAILLGPGIYPDAPIAWREVLGLLLILPLLRVLPRIVPRYLHGALYLVAALYLLLRFNSLLMAGSAFERYFLLLLTAAAAVTVAWIFRPRGPGARLDGGRLWRAAKLAARLGLLVLGLALLANIGGLVSLSRLLVNGVISSAFTAIVLFAGVAVTRATIIALLQTALFQRLNLVRWHAAAIDHWTMRILPVLAVVAWVIATTRMFQVETYLREILTTILFSSASIGMVEISLADLLGFGLAIWLGLLLSRFLRLVLSVDVYPRVSLPRGVPATVSMLVNYTVLGFAFVLAVAAAGIQLDRFALIVGALSVGIGFGLQNIINNFVSGLILAFERPVQAGDTVQVASMFGKVTRIGVRSSTVRTFDGAEVIVPNANLISNELTNWTLTDYRRRMEILVGVAYGSKPRQVMEVLLNAAKADERLLDTPPPAVLFLGFGDSSLDFSLRAWTDDFDNFLTIKSDLTVAVHDGLQAAGLEIPFPQRDLHLRSIDSAAVARIGAIQAPEVGDPPEPARDS
jgi:potassium-dependent mechanosensitive channel